MSNKAPRGVRLVITLVGARNAGKSSLINAMAGQEVAIVSDQPGTTTDPVAKHYELLPLGPVTFYDTAGLDDTGELGRLRVKATGKVLNRSDIALLVVGADGLGNQEKDMLARLMDMGLPVLVVFNKTDMADPAPEDLEFVRSKGLENILVSALSGRNVDKLKKVVIAMAPKELSAEPVLAGDLFDQGDTVLCVVPIDLAAPKGRLILPQVQVLREILDCDAVGMVVKEREIERALSNLTEKPALVITDSQVVLSVAGDVDEDIPLTTFSTLFARFKGDLTSLVNGAKAIDSLEDGDYILMCEACSHHPVADDIGRVKIPRWITNYTGKELNFEMYAGHDFPEDLEKFNLAVHCGGCMINRAEMMRRVKECRRRGVPITNYGVAISKVQGVLERIIAPFGM